MSNVKLDKYNGINISMLLFQRIVPAFRINIFRKLYSELGIVTCHSDRGIAGVASAAKDMDYENELIPGRFIFRGRKLFSQKISKTLKLRKPDIVICEYSLGNLTFWKLLVLRLKYPYKLIVWSHGIRNRKVGNNSDYLHKMITRLVISLSHAALFYSMGRRKVLVDDLPNIREKCFVANNTLDTDELNVVYAESNEVNRDDMKIKLGVSARFNLLYIGRLRTDKRIDLILGAWDLLRTRHDVGLIFIGDGEEMNRLESLSHEKNIHLPGPIHEYSYSAPWLKVADLMIMPGYVGLGIVHGFAFGLPMITCRSTSEGPFHSPEIEYLKDGYNGFFCDSNAESIAACIEKLILDPDLLARMKESALETVRAEANVERMIDGFRQAIEYVQGTPRARRGIMENTEA